MNRIAEFYESNHLMVLIVLLIVFLMYVISTKKNKDYLKIDINEKPQKNKQIKKVEVELDTQKQVMKIQIFEYTSTRLSFRRSIIEPMNDDDILIIDVLGAQNPDNNGRFKMTKRQIYQTFDNVIKTEAYVKGGNFNYKKTPNKAQQYRVF